MTEAEVELSKAIVLLLVKDKLVQVVMAGFEEREGGGVMDKDAMAAFADSSHIFSPLSHCGCFLDPLLPHAVLLDQAQVAAIEEQGGVVFVVGVEQGRMRAMGIMEGAASS